MDQQHSAPEPWFIGEPIADQTRTWATVDEQPPTDGLRNEVETQRGIIADLEHRLAVAESQRAQLAAQMIPIVEQAELMAKTVERFVAGGESYTPGQLLDTPGQFITWWADLEPERRLKEADRALRASNDAQRCFEQDHAGRIETLEAQCQLLMAERGTREADPLVPIVGYTVTLADAHRLLDQVKEAITMAEKTKTPATTPSTRTDRAISGQEGTGHYAFDPQHPDDLSQAEHHDGFGSECARCMVSKDGQFYRLPTAARRVDRLGFGTTVAEATGQEGTE